MNEYERTYVRKNEKVYVFPINAIRHLLLKEHEKRTEEISEVLSREYFREAMCRVIPKILAIASYEDAENFVHAFCRMSLQEWIDSL